jgi:hypothetical protein
MSMLGRPPHPGEPGGERIERHRFSRGDRVRLDPSQADRWVHKFRKFALTGREATVVAIPGDRMGARAYLIRFDVKRRGSSPETLEVAEEDMVPAGRP